VALLASGPTTPQDRGQLWASLSEEDLVRLVASRVLEDGGDLLDYVRFRRAAG
jgi:hypothetical protein